jgi:hypothetical protein
MIKKTVTYTDFNGNERTEDFYFNLTQFELAELDLGVSGVSGGLLGLLKQIVREKDQRQIVEYFKKIVLMSYGEKSVDGRRFIKSEEIRNGFAPTEAFSKIYMELAQDADAAAAFVNGIMPKEVVEEAKKMSNKDIAELTDGLTE